MMIFKKPRKIQTLKYDEFVQRYVSKRVNVAYLTIQVKRKDSDKWETICENKHNLGTTVGQDKLHEVMYTNVAADGDSNWGANYIALSTDAGGAASSHQSLGTNTGQVTTNEITTNGLQRVGAGSLDVIDHSAGTNETTLEHTFTATGTHTNVQLTGLFDNTVASGTSVLVHENTFTPTTLANGDELKVTWTITSTFTS